MGTLTQKTHRHPSVETRQPPRTGPIAAARPPVEPHQPSATERSSGVRQPSAARTMLVGIRDAPATPCANRDARRTHSSGLSAHPKDAMANSRRLASYTRRVPNLSAMPPAPSSRAARAMAYALTTHCSPWKDAWSPAPIEGRATLTIVVSSMTTKNPAEAPTRDLRARRSSGPVRGSVMVRPRRAGQDRGSRSSSGVGSHSRWAAFQPRCSLLVREELADGGRVGPRRFDGRRTVERLEPFRRGAGA